MGSKEQVITKNIYLDEIKKNLTIDKYIDQVQTNTKNGLTAIDAKERSLKYGENEIKKNKGNA
jgi:hypothetical protein